MHIGFHNPYLNSLSGGERYTLALAGYWSKVHSVDVFWDDPTILANAQERLHIDLDKARVVPNVFQGANVLKKLFVTSKYDLIFFLSDGSVPTSLAAHNIVHFQVPFSSVLVPGWKLSRYDVVVCNSRFTKDNLDPTLQNKAIIIYPPVVTAVSRATKKEKIILTVGRFHPAKKQDVLVEAFKKIPGGWKLVCIGGLLPADTTYFESLKIKADGYPIELVANGSFNTLQSYYKKATICWHAAGYGEDDPKLQEHFGISTVEAMAYGCVPVVYHGGGLAEIVKEGENGFLWSSPDELLAKTKRIIDNPSLVKKIIPLSIERSQDFDQTKFFSAFDKLLHQLTS